MKVVVAVIEIYEDTTQVLVYKDKPAIEDIWMQLKEADNNRKDLDYYRYNTEIKFYTRDVI